MPQGFDIGSSRWSNGKRLAAQPSADAWRGLEPLEPRWLLSCHPLHSDTLLIGEEPGPSTVVESSRPHALASVELASPTAQAPAAGRRPYGATAADTSEYMLGDVAVTLVLLESNGKVDAQTEDWSAQEISNVIAEVAQGLSWWEQTFAAQGFTSTLSFALDTTWADTPFSTSYEPIRRPHTDQYLWINQFLAARGCGSGQVGAREFADRQRLAANADWSFTVFVVDSSSDDDGMFSDDYFSYAYLGGPFLVMTYDNDGWGIGNMDRVLAHEVAHVFYALDEYPDSVSYNARGGYYNTQNLNAYDDNPHPAWRVPSLMAENDLQAQAYANHTSSTTSLEMIGWRDGDGDGMVDVLDVPLSLSLTGVLDVETGLYHVTGRSTVAALPNLNPVASSLNHAITLNEVNKLQYRLDGGPWLDHLSFDAHSVTIDTAIPVPPQAVEIQIRTLAAESGAASAVFSDRLVWTPRVAELVAAPASVTRPDDITLTATVQDANGSVVSVAFYRESNGSAGLQVGLRGDVLVGADLSSDGGWTAVCPSAGLKARRHTFYALATDDDGLTSAQGRLAATAVCTVTNALPTIGSVAATPNPVVRRDSIELTAHDVLDVDGRITQVRFYRDLDDDGQITSMDRLLGYGSRALGTDDFVLRVPTTGWATGVNTILVRAWDNEAGSVILAGNAQVANRPPIVSRLASNVAVINGGGTLWLTARCSDADGAVQQVEFFYDSDANGTLDDTDLSLGQDVNGRNGWRLPYTLPLDAPAGPAGFFAQATDNEAALSSPAGAVLRVNAPPAIGSVASNAPVMRRDLVELTAHQVTDSDGAIWRVLFYRDLDDDAQIGPADQYLGYGIRQGGTDDYVLRVATTGWTTGDNDVLVQALDHNLGWALASLSVTVTNRPPIIISLTCRLSAVRAGAVLPLVARGVGDADGTIQKVEFFADSDDDGELDDTDVLLGVDLLASGGWFLGYRVPLDAVVGLRRFFARATDNEAALSQVVSLVVRVDEP